MREEKRMRQDEVVSLFGRGRECVDDGRVETGRDERWKCKVIRVVDVVAVVVGSRM